MQPRSIKAFDGMDRKEQIDMARIWQEQHMNNGCGTSLYLAIVFFVVLLFSSCATKTVVEYRDRDVNHYNTIVQHDTLRENIHDSIYVEIKAHGDTIYNTKYIERTRWRDKIVEKHDTCYKDSVVTEYKETTKEIVKIPKIYSISLWFSIICIIFAIIKLARWLPKV